MPKPRWTPSDTQDLEELVAVHGPHKVYAHLYAIAKKYAQDYFETDEDLEHQRECQTFIASRKG